MPVVLTRLCRLGSTLPVDADCRGWFVSELTARYDKVATPTWLDDCMGPVHRPSCQAADCRIPGKAPRPSVVPAQWRPLPARTRRPCSRLPARRRFATISAASRDSTRKHQLAQHVFCRLLTDRPSGQAVRPSADQSNTIRLFTIGGSRSRAGGL